MSANSQPMAAPLPANAAFQSFVASEVARLRQFYHSGIPRSLEFRLSQLVALRDALDLHHEEICAALNRDLGKPRFEASMYEVLSSKNELRAMISHLSSWILPRPVATPLALLPASSEILYQPRGVSLIIAPFNYPFQLVMNVLAASLAAGNVALIKPSEFAPATAEILKNILARHLNPQCYSFIEGGIPETTAILSQKYDFIFFTGSETVGRVVLQAAAVHLTPTALELGGKSPVIVDTNVDLALTARRILWGKFVNAGQTCIAPDYCFIEKSLKAAFLQECQKVLLEFYTEDPSKSPDYARIINDRHFQRLEGILNHEKQENSILFGGKTIPREKFIEPTLIRATIHSKCMENEIFGPILPIIEYSSIDSVISYVNSRSRPLALYVFSQSKAFADRIIEEIPSGGVCVNDCLAQFGNSELPFGGVGESGMGRYHGEAGFKLFSNERSILRKSVYGDAPARYPPYTDGKYALMKWVSSIQSINSDSARHLWQRILMPSALAVASHKLGIRIGKL